MVIKCEDWSNDKAVETILYLLNKGHLSASGALLAINQVSEISDLYPHLPTGTKLWWAGINLGQRCTEAATH